MEKNQIEAIKNQAVVEIYYTLKDKNEVVLDATLENQPFTYLHGHNQIVSGLEKALENKKVGEKFEITVSPVEGYGEHNPNLTSKVQRKQFPKEAKLDVDEVFELTDPNGNSIPVIITNVQGDEISIDANHPLAGKELFFTIEVVSIREATKEELEHGHAHGCGCGDEH